MYSFSALYKGGLLALSISICPFLTANQWEEVDLGKLDSFDKDCLYIGRFDFDDQGIGFNQELAGLSMWTLLAGVEAQTLTFSPIQSFRTASQPAIFISATNKNDEYDKIPGQSTRDTGAVVQELKRYCPPQTPFNVNLYERSYFNNNCLYRVQDWSKESGAWYINSRQSEQAVNFAPTFFLGDSVTDNVLIKHSLRNTTILQSPNINNSHVSTPGFTMQCGFDWRAMDSDSFNPDCLYRVMLDNRAEYQMAYSVDNWGTYILASTYNSGYTQGTEITITTKDLKSYLMVHDSHPHIGTVNKIEEFCPVTY